MKSRAASTVLIASCAVTLGAQRTESPPLVGSSGVSTLRIISHIVPTYPQIAQTALVTGEVTLQVIITAAGTVAKAYVTRSVPLLDQAALDAVRQWRFEPPMVDGRPSEVAVPVRVKFYLHNGAAPFVRSRPSRGTSVPIDFDVVYERECSAGKGAGLRIDTTSDTYSYRYQPASGSDVSVVAALRLQPADIEMIHRAVDDSRVLSDEKDLRRWPDPPDHLVILPDRIEATVLAQQPRIDVQSNPQTFGPHNWYYIDVRANGTWTRLWPPVNSRRVDLYEKVGRVRQIIDARVKATEVMRRLPREQQLCPWVN